MRWLRIDRRRKKLGVCELLLLASAIRKYTAQWQRIGYFNAGTACSGVIDSEPLLIYVVPDCGPDIEHVR